MAYCKKIFVLFLLILIFFSTISYGTLAQPNVSTTNDNYLRIQGVEDMAESQERYYNELTEFWASVLLTYPNNSLVNQFCDRYFQYFYVFRWYGNRFVVFCYKNVSEVDNGTYQSFATSGIYPSVNNTKGFTFSGNFVYYSYNLDDYSLTYEPDPTYYASYNWPWQYEKRRPIELTNVVNAIKNRDSSDLSTIENSLGLISSNTSTTNSKLDVLRDKAQQSIDLQTQIEQTQQQQLQTQQEQLETQEEQLEEQKKTNEFLNKDASDSDIDIGFSDNTNDFTQDGLNNIFTMVYNAFVSDNAQDITINVPFTDKSFSIPSNLTENALAGTIFKPLIDIIKAFYWYLISRFIYLDVVKKINKIKTGDIENIENNNIKEDML